MLSAVMLARDFDKRVKVYERLPEPPSSADESVWGDVARFYLIGLGERGQGAFACADAACNVMYCVHVMCWCMMI